MNEPLPVFAEALGVHQKIGGGWMVALAEALSERGDIHLGIASRITKGSPVSFSQHRTSHFSVPSFPGGVELLRPTPQMLQRYQEIVEEFSPDLIHVHGTEWYGGLVTQNNRMGIPAVVSLQGVLGHHVRHLMGRLEFSEVFRLMRFRGCFLFAKLLRQKKVWQKRAAVEKELILGHRFFIGRTLWDRAHLRRLHPDAVYFHCHEIVRKEFFKKQWQLSKKKKHTVFAPSADYPLKGLHLLIKAAAILKREFADIQISVPSPHRQQFPDGRLGKKITRGANYWDYLSTLIEDEGLRENVSFLGRLSAGEMAESMCSAHVFALNSFVENSPNTMAEALTVGLPSVVPFSGGIPALIKDGENVLGFPPGDEAVLAEQIRKIFLSDNLAIKLSLNGRKTASERYSPEEITEKTMEIYRSLVIKNI